MASPLSVPALSEMVRTYRTTAAPARGAAGGNRFVRIVEVSPRDGLQNIKGSPVPTETKLELVRRLIDAGLRDIEVGSMVRPDRVPQMADTPNMLYELGMHTVPTAPKGLHLPVLVPNMKGLDKLVYIDDRCSQAGGGRVTDEIAVFVSATEGFSKANMGAPIEKIMAGLPEVIERAKAYGYRSRGYVSCVITCPFSGPTPVEQVLDVAQRLLDMGCYEVSMGDTTGEGNPAAWTKLWEAAARRGMPMDKLACHDTFAMALSSILSLLPLGVRTVDSSLAGLGGCPYSPGATGNVPTEDVVYALHELGYETGVDLDKLVAAGDWLCGELGIRNESRVGRALWARRRLKEAKEGEGRQGNGMGKEARVGNGH